MALAVDIKAGAVRDFLEMPNAEFIKEWKQLSKADREEIKFLVAKEISEE